MLPPHLPPPLLRLSCLLPPRCLSGPPADGRDAAQPMHLLRASHSVSYYDMTLRCRATDKTRRYMASETPAYLGRISCLGSPTCELETWHLPVGPMRTLKKCPKVQTCGRLPRPARDQLACVIAVIAVSVDLDSPTASSNRRIVYSGIAMSLACTHQPASPTGVERILRAGFGAIFMRGKCDAKVHTF